MTTCIVVVSSIHTVCFFSIHAFVNVSLVLYVLLCGNAMRLTILLWPYSNNSNVLRIYPLLHSLL